ncbi:MULTISPECIES: hypothetical protein [unclassified Nocardia]|uniref:hypothetical protein n=1 Tax=unclassified Nocardia TaxID=2637762 RepID=UPI001CE3E54C|nr:MULTISPECIES: hypothetical protein [unclassified Nocardia]
MLCKFRSLLPVAVAASALVAGPALAAAHADPQTINSYVTSYGYNDNDDGNGHYGTAVISYPQIHQQATEDLGTYDRPSTFATDKDEFAPGTIIYVANVRKYFIMEDGCVECSGDWKQHKYRVDLWMGPASMQPEPALDNCEASITGNFDIIVNPDPGLPVDTNPMFSDGQCTVHTYP